MNFMIIPVPTDANIIEKQMINGIVDHSNFHPFQLPTAHIISPRPDPTAIIISAIIFRNSGVIYDSDER